MKKVDFYDGVTVLKPETAQEMADFWAGVLRIRKSFEESVLTAHEEPEVIEEDK